MKVSQMKYWKMIFIPFLIWNDVWRMIPGRESPIPPHLSPKLAVIKVRDRLRRDRILTSGLHPTDDKLLAYLQLWWIALYLGQHFVKIWTGNLISGKIKDPRFIELLWRDMNGHSWIKENLGVRLSWFVYNETKP